MPMRFGNRRSDYDIVRVEHDRVFIIDLDLGNKSVTNDAEYVYNELQEMWPGRRVIYRDTNNKWDEIKCHDPWHVLNFYSYIEHIPNI